MICNRSKRKTLSMYLTCEEVVGHGDLDMLDDRTLDVLDRLLAAIVDVEGGVDLLTVVVELLVERHFHIDLPRGESEALGHESAGLALVARHGRKLDLPDGEGDRVALVGFLGRVVAHINAKLVDDAKGLAL